MRTFTACVCIQLGCVRMPYVCTLILMPRNPNSCLLLPFPLLFMQYALVLVVVVVVFFFFFHFFISLLLCFALLCLFTSLMLIRVLICLITMNMYII